jgi:phage/plasmid-like protein (TIGR03299 family)
MVALADAILGQGQGYVAGNAGVLRGGSRAFLQLRAPVRSIDGIEARSNVSIFNGFDGSMAFIAGFSDTIVVCKNTLAMASTDARAGLTLKHTSKVHERIETATRLIEAARKYTGALDNAILKMCGRKMSTDQWMGLVQTLISGTKGADGKVTVSGKAETARAALLAAYTKAPGAMPGTAWGALQATTYYATHVQPVRMTSGRSEAEARAESAWWGPGKELVDEAWSYLVSDEKVAALQYQTQRVGRS